MPDLMQNILDNAIYLVVFVPVVIVVLAFFSGVRAFTSTKSDVIRERLDRVVGTGVVDRLPGLGGSAGGNTAIERALGPIAKMAKPTDQQELGRLRARLSHAGYRSDTAQVVYLASKMVLCVSAGLAAAWFNKGPLQNAALLTIVVMMIAFYAPNVWLSGRVQERQTLLNRGLPDTIDLLVTCVESGLGLDAALNRVSEEIKLSSPLLSNELNQASLEMRAGVSRGDAFRRLADRTGLDELRSLAAIIVQTEMFGASVAKSLRVQADSLRVRRMQRAEERAASVAVKMTVPLVLCILPSLLMVLMGPAAVRIVRIMIPTLMGET
jgi:tight adherence protein C